MGNDNNPRSVKLVLLGPRELVEYEIQLEQLHVTSSNNISQAIVTIVFRRRMEFHVTNTFLQVM